MSKRLIECVPNFSEGRDAAIIEAIAAAIRSVDGVALLNVDPGQATNRTVYTFVGEPEPVCEAAFRAARKANELIDMSRHHGEHPRFGALDVCPLVPISGISMAETSEYAKALGKRMGDELGMTIYLYEHSASAEQRRSLADIRAGEYEGLPEKLKQPEWQPDYGPTSFNSRSGATVVGARDFLIAYNVNLNTTSTRRANAIAFDVRERGRLKRIGDPLMGEPMLDEKGEPVYEPGSLAGVRAIGWFIEEYGIAQISMNLTDLSVTPIHIAFDEVVEKAAARGVRVTGSELIGLIPLQMMLDAGKHYLRKQKRSLGVSDEELIRIATISLGLNDLANVSSSSALNTQNSTPVPPFRPAERIIEYAIRDRSQKKLVDRTVRGFIEETASESAAPGGGSISATLGALGAALATMVANLSSHKRGWDARWEEFSDWAEKGKAFHVELTRLIDEDTDAFNALMAAFGLPKGSDEEKAARTAAIQAATRGAIEVPLKVMRAAHDSMEVIKAMAEIGNPNSVSDAAVGALCARSAVMGAFLNVRINSSSLDDKAFVEAAVSEGRRLQDEALSKEAEILRIVEAKL
ncbi:MAG TPA: glutamate formimidoyltransferase [Fimbriimonadaceae bacterium]|nr:glutamate formimidoyltransferase [Fimbriimonadaceae bacterium]